VVARYRLNAPRCAEETIEGEALIIDMVSGSYYSCIGTAAVVWNELRLGASSDEVASVLLEAYGSDEDEVRGEVDAFVAALVAALLVTEDPDATAHDGRRSDVVDLGDRTELLLEEYSDLADLLLLDPVHDVSEAGWPHVGEPS
jgi:hypothetical protein